MHYQRLVEGSGMRKWKSKFSLKAIVGYLENLELVQ